MDLSLFGYGCKTEITAFHNVFLILVLLLNEESCLGLAVLFVRLIHVMEEIVAVNVQEYIFF